LAERNPAPLAEDKRPLSIDPESGV
jgi:hypothetical protein